MSSASDVVDGVNPPTSPPVDIITATTTPRTTLHKTKQPDHKTQNSNALSHPTNTPKQLV